MWNETYWGPMMTAGWWFMPLFGIVFMVIIFYLFSRVFHANGGVCGISRQNHDGDLMAIYAEYRREINDLRMEIKELRNCIDTNHNKPEGL